MVGQSPPYGSIDLIGLIFGSIVAAGAGVVLPWWIGKYALLSGAGIAVVCGSFSAINKLVKKKQEYWGYSSTYWENRIGSLFQAAICCTIAGSAGQGLHWVLAEIIWTFVVGVKTRLAE